MQRIVDPATGIFYVFSKKAGSANILAPGAERDARLDNPTGTTLSDYANLRTAPGGRTVDGLPIFKPPYSRITAIDMNTGEHLWWIPVGDTPARVRNHPALQGIDLPNTGSGQDGALMVTPSMLLYTGTGMVDGAVDASAGGDEDVPYLFAVDKEDGKRLGKVRTSSLGGYGMMTYLHEGKQYIVLQVPGRLIALALP